MLRYELLNKEWIVSPTARRVYRSTAALSLAFLPVSRCHPIAIWDSRCDSPVLKPLLLFGTLATAVTLVGMEYFLIRFDDSHPLKQVFWFVALLFAPLGPALYCYIVYSRSEVLKSACVDEGRALAP
jgi:uncharacterized membrane protein